MTIVIFIVGLLVSAAVCFALFGYTINEMRAGERIKKPVRDKNKRRKQEDKIVSGINVSNLNVSRF